MPTLHVDIFHWVNILVGLISGSWNSIHYYCHFELRSLNYLACVKYLVVNVCSRRRFGEHQAETWWSENRDRVYKRYNVWSTAKRHIGQRVLVYLFYNLREVDGGKFSVNTLFVAVSFVGNQQSIWRNQAPFLSFIVSPIFLFPHLFYVFLLS